MKGIAIFQKPDKVGRVLKWWRSVAVDIFLRTSYVGRESVGKNPQVPFNGWQMHQEIRVNWQVRQHGIASWTPCARV